MSKQKFEEPVFFLRASDALAPECIRFWADSARSVGADPKVCERTLAQADDMERWGQTYGCDLPSSA
jgi:hypothetical protein